MAISRMQEPQQIQSGIGSLQDPRQGYFLGKLVKKAGRAVKKITKSPFGKMALLGLGGYYLGGGSKLGGSLFGNTGFGSSRLAGIAKGLFKAPGTDGKGGGFLQGLIRNDKGALSPGKIALTGLGATAIAAPFLMGGDDEDEGPIDQMDPRYQVQRAKNFYSGAGDAGAGLDFMPQKKYVMQNFYAADGGRAGYANGMLVDEDDEEEFIRSGAGQRMRPQQTFLNMGGGAGEAQAEQMLMMEYVKYKNKGGDLSFEQFVKAVMQAQQEQQMPEGAGMEQPEAVQMAANGGRIGKQEGGIMEAEASEMIDMGGMEKDYRNEGGFVAMGGKERADDVPARLSKNEFVFTADAVRNAGGGDIDKGAEVMENLMSNLEQGGEISEESQGLEGAQAMYDQQQMLQSRVV
ncbi:hypothetical protein OAR20_00280 [Candidatus Pelagibacter sp.]|nr:hypothetical protein [Candidatus Pelagibacter sp.]